MVVCSLDYIGLCQFFSNKPWLSEFVALYVLGGG